MFTQTQALGFVFASQLLRQRYFKDLNSRMGECLVDCKYKDICGGCSYLDVPYEEQLSRKAVAFEDAILSLCADRSEVLAPVYGIEPGRASVSVEIERGQTFVSGIEPDPAFAFVGIESGRASVSGIELESASALVETESERASVFGIEPDPVFASVGIEPGRASVSGIEPESASASVPGDGLEGSAVNYTSWRLNKSDSLGICTSRRTGKSDGFGIGGKPTNGEGCDLMNGVVGKSHGVELHSATGLGVQILPSVCSPPFGYRSRARFRYSKEGLSFYEKKTNTPVVIRECPVLDSKLNALLARPPRLNLWELPDGELSCISTDDGVVFGDSIGWVTISAKTGTRRLPVSGDVFFQSNRVILPELIDFVVENTTGPRVMDLYSGVGTFSAFLEDAFSVVAVEREKKCLSLARRHLKNTTFYTSAVEKWNPRLESGRAVDTVIVDPPRVGLESRVPSLLASWSPSRIIYVSCYLPTLLRDVKRLIRLGYSVSLARLFDFYPNTPHMETVVLMSKVGVE